MTSLCDDTFDLLDPRCKTFFNICNFVAKFTGFFDLMWSQEKTFEQFVVDFKMNIASADIASCALGITKKTFDSFFFQKAQIKLFILFKNCKNKSTP